MPDLVALITTEQDCVRLATSGELTGRDIDKLGKNPFEIALGDNWAACRVVLDFRKTQSIDSAAIGWLIQSQREFRKSKGVLAIHSVERRVLQSLMILNLDKVLSIVTDEAAARKLITSDAK